MRTVIFTVRVPENSLMYVMPAATAGERGADGVPIRAAFAGRCGRLRRSDT
ncbi:hypothetical protein [Amycolatopsis sp. WAC 04197]|uniref:hypothetical protein n=1 Tax=Amycolatopsis sp. WAC 04197 TaxID=2203199 RepID=UPI001315A510|nr:hypothetical protein [Amycolatopsis sp. WAC 04197]